MDVLVKILTTSNQAAEALLAEIRNSGFVVRKRPAILACVHKREVRLKYVKLPNHTCVTKFQKDVLAALLSQLGRIFETTAIVVVDLDTV